MPRGRIELPTPASSKAKFGLYHHPQLNEELGASPELISEYSLSSVIQDYEGYKRDSLYAFSDICQSLVRDYFQ